MIQLHFYLGLSRTHALRCDENNGDEDVTIRKLNSCIMRCVEPGILR